MHEYLDLGAIKRKDNIRYYRFKTTISDAALAKKIYHDDQMYSAVTIEQIDCDSQEIMPLYVQTYTRSGVQRMSIETPPSRRPVTKYRDREIARLACMVQ